MRTKIFIKFANYKHEWDLVDKIKKYFKKYIKGKLIFKLKYILNVWLLQFFKFQWISFLYTNKSYNRSLNQNDTKNK